MCFSSYFPHDFDNVLTESTFFFKRIIPKARVWFLIKEDQQMPSVTKAAVEEDGKEYLKDHVFYLVFQ